MTQKLIERIEKVKDNCHNSLNFSSEWNHWTNGKRGSYLLNAFDEDIKIYEDDFIYRLFVKCHRMTFNSTTYISLEEINYDTLMKLFDLMKRYATNWNYS